MGNSAKLKETIAVGRIFKRKLNEIIDLERVLNGRCRTLSSLKGFSRPTEGNHWFSNDPQDKLN